MQNNNTTTKTQNKVLFDLGQTFMTIGAREALEESSQTTNEFLAKHQLGDWVKFVQVIRRKMNFQFKKGFRVLSAYKTSRNAKLWVITEADRSSSYILLPEEY